MIQQDFKQFHKQHPHIEKMFLEFCIELRKLGIVKIRADEVLHRMRWELLTTTGDHDICDALSVFYGNKYAMKLIEEQESFKDFFDLTVRYK